MVLVLAMPCPRSRDRSLGGKTVGCERTPSVRAMLDGIVHRGAGVEHLPVSMCARVCLWLPDGDDKRDVRWGKGCFNDDYYAQRRTIMTVVPAGRGFTLMAWRHGQDSRFTFQRTEQKRNLPPVVTTTNVFSPS